MADEILINCWIFGDLPEFVFPVRIQGNRTIGELKNELATKIVSQYPDINARHLILRRISVVENDLNAKLRSISLEYLNTVDTLQPTHHLSRVFSGHLADDHLYIVVVQILPVGE